MKVSVFIAAAFFLLTSSGANATSGLPPSDWQAPAQAAQVTATPSVRTLQVGVAGAITGDPVVTDVNGDGSAEILFPTSSGLYVLSGPDVVLHVPTSSAVTDIALLDDLNGNGAPEVVLAVSDVFFPNVRAYDTVTGEKLWDYVPAQEVFIDNLMWTEQQTRTFDLEAVDLNSDGVLDVAVTSGYLVHAIEGRTGNQLWTFAAPDNLWKVAATPDLDGDGTADLVVGGQDGVLRALSGRDGELLWETRLVESYTPLDRDGTRGAAVDRSVFDILPVIVGPEPSAIVTAEDGVVRLVDLRDGTVRWSEQVLEYVDALLSDYYRDKNGKATRPGDFNFFNLQLHLPPDSRNNPALLVVSAYLGRSVTQGQEPRGAGLFLLDLATGKRVWSNRTVSLDESARLEFAVRDGETVIILPAENSGALSLEDGKPREAGVPRLGVPGQRSGGWLYVEFGDGDFTAASRSGQMAGVWDGTGWTAAPPGQVTAVRGDFTGDAATDILVYSRTVSDRDPFRRPRTRVVYVVDGTTREKAWTYVMPEDEFALTGGIADVRPAPDLNGDGFQDIIGFTQPVDAWHDEKERRLEGSGVFVLSGADGALLLHQPVVAETYYGDWEALLTDPEELERRVRDASAAEFARRLDEEWQGEEQNRRGNFESDMDRRWKDSGATLESSAEEQLKEQVNDLDQQRRREWEEQRMKLETEAGSRTDEQRAEFDRQLQDDVDRLRGLGVDESVIGEFIEGQRQDFEAGAAEPDLGAMENLRNEFEESLQNELRKFEDRLRAEFWDEFEASRPAAEDAWRSDFEQTLTQERSRWEEKRWQEFEQNELRQQLEQWEQRLMNEEWNQRIDKRIAYVDVMRVPGLGAGIALIVATPQDVYIIDVKGELLWTRSFNPGGHETPFGDGDPEVMAFPASTEPFGDLSPLRVAGDLNGDGIDDIMLVGREGLRPMFSALRDGALEFEPGPLISLPEVPPDGTEAMTTDDLDGDGIDDIFFQMKGGENQPPSGVLVSSATGDILLELDSFDPNSLTLEPTGDLDGDGTPDLLVFEVRVEGREGEGPRLRVIGGGTGEVIWEYTDFQETHLFDNRGPGFRVMPAAAVSDISGDGVADLAIARHTTWQPGAELVVIDITRDEVVAKIVLEERDPAREQDARWHPGLAVREIGDLNGDGSPEIALVTATGPDAEHKEYGVYVVDIAEGRAIADFRVAGSKFIDLGTGGGIGLAGRSGEVYLLDVANDLRVSVPDAGVFPLQVSWTGVAPGSFNQVFVDGLEVARTNLDAASVPITAGRHEVTVRSLDEYGRGVYRTVSVTIDKSSTIVLWMALLTVALTAAAFWMPAATIIRRLRRRAANNG